MGSRASALPREHIRSGRADLVWLCLEAGVPPDAGTLSVRNTMLCELYEDQINVVQGSVGGARRSVLSVRGDHFKALR